MTINFVTIKPMEHPFNLTEFFPFAVHQAAEQVSQNFREIYKREHAMTRSEWRVLAHLGQFGAMTATQIGQSAGLHKTKVSRAVFALENRRWLTREINPDDRRVHRLSLTKKGRKNYEQLGLLAHDYNESLKQQLGGKKFQQALSLLKEIQNLK